MELYPRMAWIVALSVWQCTTLNIEGQSAGKFNIYLHILRVCFTVVATNIIRKLLIYFHGLDS
jgi:hypothetical protein